MPELSLIILIAPWLLFYQESSHRTPTRLANAIIASHASLSLLLLAGTIATINYRTPTLLSANFAIAMASSRFTFSRDTTCGLTQLVKDAVTLLAAIITTGQISALYPHVDHSPDSILYYVQANYADNFSRLVTQGGLLQRLFGPTATLIFEDLVGQPLLLHFQMLIFTAIGLLIFGVALQGTSQGSFSTVIAVALTIITLLAIFSNASSLRNVFYVHSHIYTASHLTAFVVASASLTKARHLGTRNIFTLTPFAVGAILSHPTAPPSLALFILLVVNWQLRDHDKSAVLTNSLISFCLLTSTLTSGLLAFGLVNCPQCSLKDQQSIPYLLPFLIFPSMTFLIAAWKVRQSGFVHLTARRAYFAVVGLLLVSLLPRLYAGKDILAFVELNITSIAANLLFSGGWSLLPYGAALLLPFIFSSKCDMIVLYGFGFGAIAISTALGGFFRQSYFVPNPGDSFARALFHLTPLLAILTISFLTKHAGSRLPGPHSNAI